MVNGNRLSMAQNSRSGELAREFFSFVRSKDAEATQPEDDDCRRIGPWSAQECQRRFYSFAPNHGQNIGLQPRRRFICRCVLFKEGPKFLTLLGERLASRATAQMLLHPTLPPKSDLAIEA